MVGSRVSKTPEIISVTRKTRRTGETVFVTVAHRYSDPQGLLLTGEHDIVYRDMPSDVEKTTLLALAAQMKLGHHSFERQGGHTQAINADAVPPGPDSLAAPAFAQNAINRAINAPAWIKNEKNPGKNH